MGLKARNDVFLVDILDDVISIHFKGCFFQHITDLKKRDAVSGLLDYVASSDTIRTAVLNFSLEGSGGDKYKAFFLDEARTELKHGACRYGNIMSDLVMRLAELEKITVFACHGELISLFLYMGLACHIRIVSETTVFHNAYLELGMTPIGGGPFFFERMLGTSKACEMLLLNDRITAETAHQLGLVDRVVPEKELSEAAMMTAQQFSSCHPRSLFGIARLLNYTNKDLREYLRYENREFIRILKGTKF